MLRQQGRPAAPGSQGVVARHDQRIGSYPARHICSAVGAGVHSCQLSGKDTHHDAIHNEPASLAPVARNVSLPRPSDVALYCCSLNDGPRTHAAGVRHPRRFGSAARAYWSRGRNENRIRHRGFNWPRHNRHTGVAGLMDCACVLRPSSPQRLTRTAGCFLRGIDRGPACQRRPRSTARRRVAVARFQAKRTATKNRLAIP